MEKQNYKNHARMVPGYHYLCTVLGVLLLSGSVVNLVKSSKDNLYSASLILLMVILLLFIAFYARSFALRAQDRVIKAEENFRYYRLTGQLLPQNLTIRQIIGLRFASDKEYLELIKSAGEEKLSEKEIKKRVVDWKPDNYRV